MCNGEVELKMIGEIIMLLVIAFLAFMFYDSQEPEFKTKEAGVIFFLIFALPFLYVNLFVDNSSYNVEKEYIVSLERNQETSGSFVLGFGHITTDPVYYAYKKTGSNSYILIRLRGDITLVEDDNERPRFETTTERTCKKDIIFYDCDIDYNITKKIYVPEGTIRKEFNG